MQKLGEKEELQILEYWYINEFLSQEDWPDENGSKRDIENKLSSKRRPEYLGESCLKINKDEDIYSSISDRVTEHEMSLWGDITVYIGKIAREDCVKEIAKLLDSVDDRPEKSSKSIAWASLQIDSKGEYVENSISLSPILWAIKGLKNRKDHISDILNPESYKESIEEFEETLRKTKKTSLSENNPQNIKNNSEITNVAVTRAKKNLIIATDTEALELLSTDKKDDLYNLIKYVKNNGNIEVEPNDSYTLQIGKSNGSRYEDMFFETVSHFCTVNKMFKAKRNVPLSVLFYNDPILSKSKLEFDIILCRIEDTLLIPTIAIEIQGGEHFGNIDREKCDARKAQICKDKGITLIEIPNSFVKSYNKIKQLILQSSGEKIQQLELF